MAREVSVREVSVGEVSREPNVVSAYLHPVLGDGEFIRSKDTLEPKV